MLTGGRAFGNEVVMLVEGSVGRNMSELSPEQRTTTGNFHHINRNQEERGILLYSHNSPMHRPAVK